MLSNRAFQEKIRLLNEFLAEHIEELLDELGVGYRRSGQDYILHCPIHGGDSWATTIYSQGSTVPGFWKCRTAGCHDHFAKNLIGFTRGVMSANNGWSKPGDKTYGFKNTIDFLCRVFNIDFDKYEVNLVALDKRDFIKSGSERKKLGGRPLEEVRAALDIPSPYFLGRGIPWQTLINFNVGECMNPDKKMFQRATVPVLDIEGKIAVGSTGRSIFEKCPKCKGFHNPDEYCSKVAKWINAGKFADTYLYNLWNAKDKIKETGVAVLCEGQADVWAAWSAGIKNVVGIFGTELSPGQMATLEELGTMGLVLCLDNDDAGKSGIARIVDKYSKLFYTNAPTFSAHDLGDMSSDKIKEIIIPEINRMEKKCSIS